MIGGFASGKSRPLLMEAITQCIEVPGANAIILRKTMPDLKRTVIDKFEADVPKKLYERGSQEKGTFNKSDKIVYFPPVDVIDPKTGLPEPDPLNPSKPLSRQSKLYFGACERVEDVGKYLSTEFLFIAFEEIGEFPYLIYDAMEGRNRCTLPGAYPCMAGATNPFGIGYGWIKDVFIDHKPVFGMDPDKFNADDYWYIHSTVDDNPILIKDKKYVESLEKSPNRDAIRWGRLDIVKGRYFGNFDEPRHVLPESAFIFQSWQPVWVGWDYGFGHFAVITFWTKAILKPRFEGEKPRIVNVLLKEVVMQETEPIDQAKALVAAIPTVVDADTKEARMAWDIDSVHFSWERFNRTVSNRTVADEVSDYLVTQGLPRCTPSNRDRVAGWTKMHEMLEYDEWFIVKDKCPNCVHAIPLLDRGDGVTCSIEDVVKPKNVSLADDCGDSMRYGVAGVLLDEGEKPKEQLLREKLAGIPDEFTKHTVLYREWLEHQAAERKKMGPRSQVSWQNKLMPPGRRR